MQKYKKLNIDAIQYMLLPRNIRLQKSKSDIAGPVFREMFFTEISSDNY